MSSSLLLQELCSILYPLPTCMVLVQSFNLSLAGFRLVQVKERGRERMQMEG